MKKQILTLTAVLSLTVTSLLTPPSLEPAAKAAEAKSVIRFKDVSTSHWANSAITWAVKENIVAGYPDETFKPSKSVTRAEFIKMLVDALHIPHSSGSTPWYQAYVHEAIESKIHSEADFKSYKEPITRLEMIRLAARSLARSDQYDAYLKAFDGLYNGDIPFVDYRELKKADVPYTGLVVGSKIMNGFPDASLGLKKNATRAEAVAIIQNLVTTQSSKHPSDFQYLQELKELAETGMNATAVSELEPLLNLIEEQKVIEHYNFDAKLKRVYVIPTEGDTVSFYERKFLWDRDEHPAYFWVGQTGYVTAVFDVTYKKDGNELTFSNYSFLNPSSFFTYSEPRNKFGFVQVFMSDIFEAKKGDTIEFVLYGEYSNEDWDIGVQTNMAYKNSGFTILKNPNKGK
ncbi:S-layer homology domain-containing protein [Marinicrinis sediminis]|uniref:S-layer homology domain-containing protein n=1 Tax=Marinicrinis sediminis TaxID=1652465 RepID=A0ABW5RCB9_9BACL